MIVTKELALKAAGGLAAAAAASGGVYYVVNNLNNHLTVFDQGLIDYLEKGGDIQFKITKSGTTEEDMDATKLVLDAAVDSSLKIKISAKTDGTVGGWTDNTAEPKATKTTLKKLNGEGEGTDWTWTCEIKLAKDGVAGNDKTAIKDDQKNRIFENTNNGILGILKNTYGSDESKKKIKMNFIDKCAKARSNSKMTSNEITTSEGDIVLKLKKESDKLVFSDTKEFDKWFPTVTVS